MTTTTSWLYWTQSSLILGSSKTYKLTARKNEFIASIPANVSMKNEFQGQMACTIKLKTFPCKPYSALLSVSTYVVKALFSLSGSVRIGSVQSAFLSASIVKAAP